MVKMNMAIFERTETKVYLLIGHRIHHSYSQRHFGFSIVFYKLLHHDGYRCMYISWQCDLQTIIHMLRQNFSLNNIFYINDYITPLNTIQVIFLINVQDLADP
jgi:hypothetical protein